MLEAKISIQQLINDFNTSCWSPSELINTKPLFFSSFSFLTHFLILKLPLSLVKNLKDLMLSTNVNLTLSAILFSLPEKIIVESVLSMIFLIFSLDMIKRLSINSLVEYPPKIFNQ
jgi:hypothetical protein